MPDYCLLLTYRPRKDERLSWPSWLTCSGWLTHLSGHPSAAGRAQDRESSLAKDRRYTAVPRNQQRNEEMLDCGMVRFPTGYYWHCSWSLKKAPPGMCPCKWWTFWTPFLNKLLETISIFHVFLVEVPSIHHVSFLLLCWCLSVDRPTVFNCKALSLLRTVNKQKVKCWYFAWC